MASKASTLLALAGLASMVSVASAADQGTLYTVLPETFLSVLTDDGSIGNPYELGSVGTFAMGTGKLLKVVNEVSVGASFVDFITFTVPGTSQGQVTPTAFNLGAQAGQFSYFNAYVFAGTLTPNSPFPGGQTVPLSSAIGNLSFTNAQLDVPGGFVTQTFNANNLVAGSNYYIYIAGGQFGTSGAKYNLAVQALPVPEPGALAMLLAGLGVVGLVVRRRSNAV